MKVLTADEFFLLGLWKVKFLQTKYDKQML